MGNAEHTPQKRVWTQHLFVIFASLLLFFNTLSLLPSGIHHVRSFLQTHDHHSFSQLSTGIGSLETVDVGQLQGGEEAMIVLNAAADLLGAVSAQHNLTSLQALSKDLHRLAEGTHKPQGGSNLQSRGLIDTFTSLFNKGVGSLATPAGFLGDGVGRGATTGLKINNGVKQTTAEKPSGINAVAGNLGFGLSNGLTGTLNTSQFNAGTGAAAAALGSGLGGGTASGLGLNKSAVAAPQGSGIPAVAGNLGNGLTQSLFSNIDMSKIMAGLPTGMLQSAVVSAGKGLGEGAVEGLNLPMNSATTLKMSLKRAAETAAETNKTAGSGIDISKISFGFTKSLSSSFLGAVDVQKLATQAMAQSNLSSMVGPTLVGAGSGLGSGAAQGLGLSNAAVVPTTGPDAGAPEVAHNFAYQLTTSFLANGTFSSLQSKLMSMVSTKNISGMIAPAAKGAGSGIGQGAAVGLGLQDAPMSQGPMDGDIATVTRDFTFGLTSNFLANGTVSRLQEKATSLLGGGENSTVGGMMSALQGISVSKAAEGLARGLVDGAGNSISVMGGIKAIISGAPSTEVMMQAATPVFETDNFNDTVGGAATAFGQGLGGQGVTLVTKLAKMFLSSSSAAAPSNNISTPALRSRSTTLAKRASVDTSFNITDIATGLLKGLNLTSLDFLLQKGVDTLTCEGIGGFVEVFKGLQASGTIPSTLLSGGNTLGLPDTTFTVTSQGNEFKINPATKAILVNGIGLNPLTILIVAHAFLVILAYFIAIPFALLISSGNDIATMLGRPYIWAQASKYRFYIWCFVVMPLSIGGVGLGIFLLGSASHGQTLHGIIGFLVMVLTFVALILEMKFNARIKALKLLRGAVLTVLLTLGIGAFVTGFVDIQRISLCTVRLPDAVLIGAALLVAGAFTIGITVVVVRMFMEKWMAREMKGGDGGGGGRTGSGEERGIGGFVEVFKGLQASGTIPSTLLSGGNTLGLPDTTFTVTSQGNEFKINPATKAILVNGIGLNPLTILIVAHAFLVILAYFIAIPFALLISSGNDIATMLGRPYIWAQASKYRFYIWCFVVMPLSIGGVGLGIFLLGSASHGQTLHGIIGFLVMVLTFVALILEMKFNARIKALKLLRGAVLTVLLTLGIGAFVTGFVDIQRISLCTVRLPDAVLIGAALLVAGAFTIGITVVVVRMFMEKWMAREMKGGMGVEGGEQGVEKSGFENEKVSLKDRIKNLKG
ncbi:hypothetical protein NHQ30_003237 [Ciborinia camelliae]|nr:hypothetical protein NHQ30_003237 [Ciborinia camelliae]